MFYLYIYIYIYITVLYKANTPIPCDGTGVILTGNPDYVQSVISYLFIWKPTSISDYLLAIAA